MTVAQSQLSIKELTAITRPEIELLLCCGRTHIDLSTKERIQELLQQEVDWTYLMEISARHRVIPLLYRSLNATCPEAVPESISVQLRNFLHANAQHNSFLTKKLLDLLDLFAEKGITAIPFKGPVLATSAYGNLSLRQIKDLDFFVEERNFHKAVDLLVSQGYESIVQVPWEYHLISNDGSYSIDLHREIVPKHLSCSLRSNYIWEHLENFPLFGTSLPNLKPEAYLLILCLNGTKDCWQKLNRICDVAELIRAHPNMDWQQVMEQVEKMGFKRLIFLGLLLARNLLGASFPDFIWQQVQCDLVANSLALQVHKQLFSETWESCGTVETTFFHIKTRERWQDKAQSFFGLMMLSGWLHPTQRDRDVTPLPSLLSFLYYLIRPIRVFRRYRHVLFSYFRNSK